MSARWRSARGLFAVTGLTVAMLAAVALAASGCGTADERGRVGNTLARFAAATAQKDYRTLCRRVLAPAVVEPLDQVGLTCERALGRAFDQVEAPQLAVGRIEVHGSTAAAAVHTTAANQPASDDTIRLVRVGGQWRVSSLGAAPTSQPRISSRRSAQRPRTAPTAQRRSSR